MKVHLDYIISLGLILLSEPIIFLFKISLFKIDNIQVRYFIALK